MKMNLLLLTLALSVIIFLLEHLECYNSKEEVLTAQWWCDLELFYQTQGRVEFAKTIFCLFFFLLLFL